MRTARSDRRLRRLAGGAALATAVTLGWGRVGAAAGEVVTVTPDKNLPDTATVQVSGTGFAPNSYVFLRLCADVGGAERCSTSPLGADRRTNGSGTFTASAVTVTATFQSDGYTIECRTGCRVRARDLTGRIGSDAISFQRYAK